MTTPSEPGQRDNDDAPSAFHAPPTPRRALGHRLLVVLPLLAIAAALSWVWRDAPRSRQLHLYFGGAGSGLVGLELSCEDGEGLESGARWSFTQGAPQRLTHTTAATGRELVCRIFLESPTQRREVVRKLRFDADEASLRLESELR